MERLTSSEQNASQNLNTSPTEWDDLAINSSPLNHERSANTIRQRWQRFGQTILKLFHRSATEINPSTPTKLETTVTPITPNLSADVVPASPTETLEGAKAHDPITDDDHALIEAMEQHRAQQSSFLRGERAQEIREQQFNDSFVTLEELEAAADTQQDGINKRILSYQDQDIPVYDLSGYSFRYLQHAVDYKVSPESGEFMIGHNTAQRLINNPSLWLRNRSEIHTEGHISNQDGTSLSTSYVDSDINFRNGGVQSPKGIIYGFSSLRPDSLLSTNIGDGRTSNQVDGARPGEFKNQFSPQQLAQRSTQFYNEVLLRRYDSAGQPQAPDFLITHNGHITDDTKRHAAFFNIPIINIDDEAYAEKQKNHVIDQIASITPDSSYEEIFNTFQNVSQSSLGIYHPWQQDIFQQLDNPDRYYNDNLVLLPDGVRDKMRALMETIEPAKRLEMISHKLTDLIASEDDIRLITPMHIMRNNRHNRNDPYHRIPTANVDSLSITYDYPTQDGLTRSIKTIIDDTDPAYAHLSQLVDQYQANGGSVYDNRINNTP